MILHLMINSLIVFLALALTVELFLSITGMKNARVRYLCRALPFLKIPFDIAVFLLWDSSLFINLNPLSCEIYVFELLAKMWPTDTPALLHASDHLIIPQYIATQISPLWLMLLTLTVLFIAIGGIILKLCRLFYSRRCLKQILHTALPYSYPIANSLLQKHLIRAKAILLTSSDIDIPFAADMRYILLPQSMLEELSNDEIEAVIGHELQHLKWKDPLFKLFFSLICSLCWWIPTKWWLKRLIADQEQASDSGVYHYNIDHYALAIAVTKILYKSKNIAFDKTAICFFGSPKSTHVDRLEYILNEHKLSSSHRQVLRSVFTLIFSSTAFMCVWMC